MVQIMTFYMKKIALSSYVYISIIAAILTIGLKFLAYTLTNSVGLLSDALESVVNLVAACIALWALKLAEKPPDDNHIFGHTKAEYFSSIIEGGLIFVASLSIGYAAISRLMSPEPVEKIGLGIIVASLASLINLGVGLFLLKIGKKYDSITLRADAHHLFTDVWTTAGVIVGVGLVAVTKLQILDPIIAILIAANILYTGFMIVKQSAMGFLDTQIPLDERKKIIDILNKYKSYNVDYHAFRTRISGTHKFLTLHLLIPHKWTIQKGHDISEKIESEIRKAVPNLNITTHMEPVEDPKSNDDIEIIREE